MKQGDLVRITAQFINTASRPGDLGLLLDVRPREKLNPMGWIDRTQHTHEVLAAGEVMLYREEDLERVEER
jgi:hypothetical protein